MAGNPLSLPEGIATEMCGIVGCENPATFSDLNSQPMPQGGSVFFERHFCDEHKWLAG